MITRYSDLAANERTYLAWMGTSLALARFVLLHVSKASAFPSRSA